MHLPSQNPKDQAAHNAIQTAKKKLIIHRGKLPKRKQFKAKDITWTPEKWIIKKFSAVILCAGILWQEKLMRNKCQDGWKILKKAKKNIQY